MISIFGCICCGSILSLWPWGLILFSFVLNALSYIRDRTLFMAKGGGGGEGGLQNQWKCGVHFSNAVEFSGGTPFLK